MLESASELAYILLENEITAGRNAVKKNNLKRKLELHIIEDGLLGGTVWNEVPLGLKAERGCLGFVEVAP